jgi:hypothetical protein
MLCVAEAGNLETLGVRFGTFQMIIGPRLVLFLSSLYFFHKLIEYYKLSYGSAHYGRPS